MTHRPIAAGMGLAIGLALAAPSVYAQVQQETTTTTVRNEGGSTTQIHTVTTVIGSSVRLQDGGTYGKIQDIVLNESGCLEYVVVAYEDQYYVVPWTVARVNYQERSIVLNTTQQDLRQVAFSRNDWRGVTYSQVSQKAQQVFRSAAGGRGGRLNPGGVERDGDRARPEGRRDGDRARPEGRRDGDRARPEGARGPAGKDRSAERPRDRDESPDRVAPRDRAPGKESDRPRRKDGAAPRKGEDRPAANPADPVETPK